MDEQAKDYFANLAGADGKNKKIESQPADIDQEISITPEEAVIEPALAEKVSIHPKATKAPKTHKVESELDFMEDDFTAEPEGQLTVDVYQTEKEIVIQSTVAGVKQEDLVIDITSESVSIKGKREQNETVEDDDFFYQECYWGRFSRSIILPQEINPDKSSAILKDGILTIRLPKQDYDRRKKLRVKIT